MNDETQALTEWAESLRLLSEANTASYNANRDMMRSLKEWGAALQECHDALAAWEARLK